MAPRRRGRASPGRERCAARCCGTRLAARRPRRRTNHLQGRGLRGHPRRPPCGLPDYSGRGCGWGPHARVADSRRPTPISRRARRSAWRESGLPGTGGSSAGRAAPVRRSSGSAPAAPLGSTLIPALCSSPGDALPSDAGDGGDLVGGQHLAEVKVGRSFSQWRAWKILGTVCVPAFYVMRTAACRALLVHAATSAVYSWAQGPLAALPHLTASPSAVMSQSNASSLRRGSARCPVSAAPGRVEWSQAEGLARNRASANGPCSAGKARAR